MKNFLLSAIAIATGIVASAQSPTTTTASTDCTVFRNFNNSDEGFSSPSIYSGGDDVAFFWNAGAGAEIESSGLIARSASLISPIYFITAPGQVTTGFSYSAPVGTEYRIRIISGVIGGPVEVLANTANGPVYTALPGTSGSICMSLSDADLTIGRAVRFELTFRMNQPGNVIFDDLALSVAAGPLPVTFEGFVARRNADGTVKLLWNVGEEVNVKGYYVESSTDGFSFTNMGYVTATGSPIYSMDYPGRPVQTMFFRVRNYDYDGRSKYTPVIKVYVKDGEGLQVQAYPVPARDQVTIQHEKASANSMISLLSPDGRVAKHVRVVLNTLQTQININDLGTGVYIIRYDNGDGLVQTGKLIKD